MSNGIKVFSLIVLLELLACGFLYYQKSSEPTPPVPNLMVTDELTRQDLTALIAETQTPEDWHWLALVYMANGFFSEANATFERASELLPKSAEVAFDYGFCLSRTGNLELSNQQFEKSIELKHPNATQAKFFIGRNYLRAEDPDQAAIAFESASRIPLSKYELAKILVRQGDFDKSVELLKEVVRSEPGAVQTFMLRTQIAQAKGDRLETLGQSIESDGNWVRIRSPFGDERQKLMANYGTLGYEKAVREGVSMLNARDHRGAQRHLVAVQEAEWNPVTQDALIELKMFTGRMREAIELINEKIERFGPSSDMLLKLGKCQMRYEMPEKAVESWLRGGDINSDKSAWECYQALAGYYRDTVGDQATSEKYQTQGLILYAYEVLSYQAFEEALPLASMATRFSPESAEAQFIMARVQLGRTKVPEAVAALKRCLELDPTHGRAMMYLEAIGVDE